MRIATLVGLLFVLSLSPTAGADDHVAIADPYYGLFIEGHVHDATGRALSGVVIDRVTEPRGTELYGSGVFRTRTDGSGRFEIAFAGIGESTGNTWYLRIHRDDCEAVFATVALERGVYRGREADVKTGVDVVLRRCTASAPDAGAR